jgi:ABC-type transport system involved in multi-copper enzyme maturation permease subunit
MKWGLGPVFFYECLTGSRRWQGYAVRAAGVLVLLAAMATIAWSKDALAGTNSPQKYATLGGYYFYALISVELALVMLAAPAATAGAICQDRSAGNLAHVLTTDLSDSEIVLGKLASRPVPVLGLVACTWPVLAIASLLGGIDPARLPLAVAVIVAVAAFACSMALLLSVWARKPHEVVIVVYAFWMLVLLLSPIWELLTAVRVVGPQPRWVLLANPFYTAIARQLNAREIAFWEYVSFFGVALGAASAFTALAVWRMRPVACRTAGDNPRARLALVGRLRRWLPGPSLEGNPVLWREWRRSRPSAWLVWLCLLVGSLTGGTCVIGAITAWMHGFTPYKGPKPEVMAGLIAYLLQVIFGLLVLAAVAPASMSEERDRGSLDVLNATTLSTRSIVLGKWWGTFRMVPLLAIGPGLMALALATAHLAPQPAAGALNYFFHELSLSYRLFGVALLVATILAHAAATTSVGLALAVWLKRQSRAIEISIGLFVLVAIGWPIAVLVIGGGGPADDSVGLAAASLIFSSFYAGLILARRDVIFRNYFWWTAFWVVEATLLAAGLLWLIIQTFDRAIGRMPERIQPGIRVAWAVTIALLGAAIGIAIWGFDLILTFNPDVEEVSHIMSFTMVVMIELLAMSVVVAVTRSARQQARPGRRIALTSA